MNFQASDSKSDDILLKIRDMLVQNKLFQFEIHLSFHINKNMTKKERKIFANKIFMIIIKNVPRDEIYITIENDYEDLDNFPGTIGSVTIVKVPGLKLPFVTTSKFGLMQKDMIMLLTDIIYKKEQKLPLYKGKCDERWLLIHTVDMSSGSFFAPSKESLKHNYICAFNKIFFLNSFDGKVHELSSYKKIN